MDEKIIHLIPRRQIDDYPIFLGSKLTSKPFEQILIEHWTKTQETLGRIIFVLEEVQWASLTEVLMLTLWAIYLRNLGKQVSVCLPFCGILRECDDNEYNLQRRKAVCSFVSRWQFSERLDKCKINVYGGEQSYFSWTERDDPRYCKVLPLKFFSRDDTEGISNLRLESIVYQILSEHSCLDPFESRIFSDIIFHEIAKNIFDHASDDQQIPGLISIGMIKKNIFLEEEYGVWDSSYFKKLGERSYLQIVLGDHGKGIFKTLFKAYKDDEHLNKRYYKDGQRCDDEPLVLRYSLEKLSTRYTSQSRLRYADIPRGLAWVYDVIREYKGFLSIRSGSTRIGISFLPGDVNKLLYDPNPLANFGGTVFQIILPEYKPSEISSFQLSSEPFLENPPNKCVLSIADYWRGREDTQESYDSFLDKLDETVRPLGEDDIVFIDFSGISWDKNSLTELLRKIMYLQGEILIICFNINFSHLRLLTEFENVFLSKHRPIKEGDIRITPFVDIRGRAFFLGCQSGYQLDLLKQLFEVGEVDLTVVKDSFESEKIARFVLKNRHIIRRAGNRLKIRASMMSFSELFNEVIENQVKYVFENPPQGLTIVHKGLFHLPSGKYATKFLQLGHLFQVGNWARLLSYAVIMKIHLRYLGNVNIDFILGCTASASPLIEHIAEGLSLENDEYSLCIETYVDSSDHPDFEEIPEGNNILIVTDVISTGGLIERMVEAVLKRKANPVAIAAIVDTRKVFESPIGIDGSKVEVFALYHDFIYKDSRPFHYNGKGQLSFISSEKEVVEIDPITATPCYEIPSSPPAIIEPEDFFKKYLQESFATINRHVVTGGTHFCFYVDTREIFQNEQVRSVLIRNMIDNLQKEFKRKLPDDLTILYPWGSNAAYATPFLASKIKKTFSIKNVITRYIFRTKSKQGWRFGNPDKNYESVIRNKTVLIWDDGSNSGDTLSQLVDYACSFNPQRLLVYILISRFEPFYRNYYQRITSYKGRGGKIVPIKIVFVTSLDLPTYKPNNCPVCKKLELIESDCLESFANLEAIKEHIDREKKRLKAVRLKNIRKEIKVQDYSSMAELPKDSEKFRREMSNLVTMREAVAKIESLISTEKDRTLLRNAASDKIKLGVLGRIIRDEPEIWDKIRFQCPALIESLINFSKDALLKGYDDADYFDLVAIEILFSKGLHKWVIENLERILLRLQNSQNAIDCFIYFVIKILADDEMVLTLQKCRDICESNRADDTPLKALTRVKISKSTQWARLNRAKNAGSRGLLKEAIISLENIYNEDPHKTGLESWTTLMGTHLSAGFETWSLRYESWKERLNPIMQVFVENIETLQSVLSKIPSINPYLLSTSTPSYLTHLIALDEKLHNLCIESLEGIVREQNYKDFDTIVKRLNRTIISKESPLGEIIAAFPTNLSEGTKSVLEQLKDEINEKKISLKISEIQPDLKILFNKALFDITFKEFIRNMCKHSEEYGDAELATNIANNSVEVNLTHSGRLKHSKPYGVGQSIIDELVLAQGGEFFYPKEVGENRIESKIIFRRW